MIFEMLVPKKPLYLFGVTFALILIISGSHAADEDDEDDYEGSRTTRTPKDPGSSSYPGPGYTTNSTYPPPRRNDSLCPENCRYQPVNCECSAFYSCANGTYNQYTCPGGLHFNRQTLQCDVPEAAGCDLNPEECCDCRYIPAGNCSATYFFQDRNRTATTYTGSSDCIKTTRNCENDLIWNPDGEADGACDLRRNVHSCRKEKENDEEEKEKKK